MVRLIPISVERQDGAKYTESKHSGTLLDTAKHGDLGTNDCVLCKSADQNIANLAGVTVRVPIAPYYPGHFLLMPTLHRNGLNDLSSPEFSSLISLIAHVSKGMQDKGVPITFTANEGYIAGQTIPHLHVHGLPTEIQTATIEDIHKLGVNASEVSGVKFADPLSIQILYSIKKQLAQSSSPVLRNAQLPTKPGEPLVLHFKSFNHLVRNRRAIARIFNLSKGAFTELESNPNSTIEIPEIYNNPKRRREVDVRLLNSHLLNHWTDAASNFGANWAIVSSKNGVEFHFTPRATAAIASTKSYSGTAGKITKIPETEIAHAVELAQEAGFKGNSNDLTQVMDYLQERRISGIQHSLNAVYGSKAKKLNSRAAELDTKRLDFLKQVIAKPIRRLSF